MAELVTPRSEGAEPVLIFQRGDKRTHHSLEIVWLPVVQHVQPEIVSIKVWFSPQVLEILRQHERSVVFRINKLRVTAQSQ
jgi:hypothetical protein